jgi:hypothetical protein
LPIGTYVVRVIGMVPTEEIEQYRKPLTVALTVNDQAGGGSSYYPQRAPYWDDFYAVAEIYFNADEARAYQGTVTIGADSRVPLFIHAVELHDVLAGLPGVAAKTKPSFFSLQERDTLRRNANANEVLRSVAANVYLDDAIRQDKALAPAERAARDQQIWNAFLPLNAQRLPNFPDAFPMKELYAGPQAQAIQAQSGSWEWEGSNGNHRSTWLLPPQLVNNKLNLRYSREDLLAHRPLPGPYPAPDSGGGVYLPAGGGHAEWFTPLASLNLSVPCPQQSGSRARCRVVTG